MSKLITIIKSISYKIYSYFCLKNYQSNSECYPTMSYNKGQSINNKCTTAHAKGSR